MKEKFLPIGTVVYLKDKKRKVMITSYLIFSKGNEEKKVYDYGASTFPEGILDSNYAFAFNHEDIEEVIHMGLEDDDQKKLNKFLKNSEKELREKLAKNEI